MQFPDVPYDLQCHLVTHNSTSLNKLGSMVANQSRSLREQWCDGIRCFKLPITLSAPSLSKELARMMFGSRKRKAPSPKSSIGRHHSSVDLASEVDSVFLRSPSPPVVADSSPGTAAASPTSTSMMMTTNSGIGASASSYSLNSNTQVVPFVAHTGGRSRMLDPCNRRLRDVLSSIKDLFETSRFPGCVTIFINVMVSQHIMSRSALYPLLYREFVDSGVAPLMFDSQHDRNPWPTPREMNQMGQPFVVFIDELHGDGAQCLQPSSSSSSSHSASSQFGMFHSFSEWVVETRKLFKHESDFDDRLRREASDEFVGQRMLMMHHYLTGIASGSVSLASEANTYASVVRRAEQLFNRYKKMPGFLQVDFYEVGAVVPAAQSLNRRWAVEREAILDLWSSDLKRAPSKSSDMYEAGLMIQMSTTVLENELELDDSFSSNAADADTDDDDDDAEEAMEDPTEAANAPARSTKMVRFPSHGRMSRNEATVSISSTNVNPNPVAATRMRAPSLIQNDISWVSMNSLDMSLHGMGPIEEYNHDELFPVMSDSVKRAVDDYVRSLRFIRCSSVDALEVQMDHLAMKD
eukprot:ANDGO_08175.mRNA.1 hypothetical protein